MLSIIYTSSVMYILLVHPAQEEREIHIQSQSGKLNMNTVLGNV